MDAENKLLLLGCGILAKEVRLLIERNNWHVDTRFVDSSLHVDFNKLSTTLNAALEEEKERETIVFYGACHPRMEQILANAGTLRTYGQNCVSMLLGHDLFMEELEKGAFFLIEDWARRWDEIIVKTFGNNDEVVRRIFQGDRKYLLCLRTPCSGDFSAEAEAASKKVGLPLRWMDVTLDNLESVIAETIKRNESKRP